ncbi:MAG: hypothetical protein R2911_29315 [Caldilineaceae bacterium]
MNLGNLGIVTPDIMAGLFAIDLAYLEDLYQRINSPQEQFVGAVCPYCNQQFELQVAPIGEA